MFVYLYGVVVLSPLQDKPDAGHTVCYIGDSRPHVAANDVENLSVRHFSSESLLTSLTTCRSVLLSLFPSTYVLFQLPFPQLCVSRLPVDFFESCAFAPMPHGSFLAFCKYQGLDVATRGKIGESY